MTELLVVITYTLTPFKTKTDEINTPFKTEPSENHTLSGGTSSLKPEKGVPPPPPGINLTIYQTVNLPALAGFGLPPSHPLDGANFIATPIEYSSPTRPLHLLECWGGPVQQGPPHLGPVGVLICANG